MGKNSRQAVKKISCIPLLFFLPSMVLANDYLSNSAQHKDAPSSPNITSPRNTEELVPEVLESEHIWNGVQSSFYFPIGQWEDDQGFFHGLSGNVGYNYPLLETPEANIPADATSGPSNTNQTLTLSLKYSILGSWFVSGTAYHYIDQDQQQAWNPDFTYVFGYSDWRPYTLSLVYANYGGNRFNPDEGSSVTNFNQGTWSLGWKFPIVEPMVDWFTFTEEGSIGCQVDFNYTHEYFNLETTEYLNGHKTVSLGCKYSIFGNWYINGAAFYYLDNTQKQPWNPDYTYGFGYFDWHPGTITLQYNNYSGNRWNSTDRGEGTGRFIDGAISLSYSFSF